jgi:hypothetical protein
LKLDWFASVVAAKPTVSEFSQMQTWNIWHFLISVDISSPMAQFIL